VRRISATWFSLKDTNYRLTTKVINIKALKEKQDGLFRLEDVNYDQSPEILKYQSEAEFLPQ
jgi:hypothetical protein